MSSCAVTFSAEVFWSNWGPDYRFSEKLDQSFFSVFAIFFPSGEFSWQLKAFQAIFEAFLNNFEDLKKKHNSTHVFNFTLKNFVVTGLQAGANISGDLKDPASSIPKGTLLALLISAISYAVFVVFAGGSAMRDASGDIVELMNHTLIGVVPSCAATKVLYQYRTRIENLTIKIWKIESLTKIKIEKLGISHTHKLKIVNFTKNKNLNIENCTKKI